MNRTKARTIIVAIVILILTLMLSACDGDDMSDDIVIKPQVNLVYPRDGSGGIQRLMTEFEQLRGDVTINAIEVPGDRDGYFSGYTAVLAASQRLPDVMILHDTWMAELAAKGILMKLDDEHSLEVENYYFQGMSEAVTWQESKYAMPLWQDMPLLYYRTDLLDSAPNTWSELAKMAENTIEDFDLSYGLIFSADDVNARAFFIASLLVSHNALPDFSQGHIDYNETNMRSAFDRLIGMIEDDILSRDVLDMSIEDSRNIFESGNCIFMTNWSYAARLFSREDSPLAGRVDSAPIPMAAGNYEQRGLMSGWVLAISNQTAQRPLAKAIVSYLTVNNNQQRMALENGQMPAKTVLYSDSSWQNAINISQALPNMMGTGIPLRTGSNPENRFYVLSEVLVQAFNGASSQQLVDYVIGEIEPEVHVQNEGLE